MRREQSLSHLLPALGLFISLSIAMCVCGCSGNPGGSVSLPPSNPTITISPATAACASGAQLSFSAVATGTTNPPLTFDWTSTAGTISAAGIYMCPTVTSPTAVKITATSTLSGYTNVQGAATVTVNPASVTGVSLVCSSVSVTNIQSVTCTPNVTVTGSLPTTTNFSVALANAATLSVTSDVPSGTQVTVTPAQISPTGTYPYQAVVTATSVADPTQSATVTITVSLRTIRINSSTGPLRSSNCSGIFTLDITQTGITAGDTFYLTPYPSTEVFQSTPASTFSVIMQVRNDSGHLDCSPGDYDGSVGGVDSVTSNTLFFTLIGPFNVSAGHNSTDEYVTDFAAGKVCPFKLTDGTLDGICLANVEMVNVLDGDDLVGSFLGSGVIGASNVLTGSTTADINRPGDNIAGIGAKNGIFGYTTEYTAPDGSVKEEVAFGIDDNVFTNITDGPPVGITPGPMTMVEAGSSDPDTATALVLDQEVPTVYWTSVVKNEATQTVTAAANANSLALPAFAPVSQIPTQIENRYIVGWDANPLGGAVSPVVTKTNPDGSAAAYEMGFALLDTEVGKQLGTYLYSTTTNGVTTSIPSNVVAVTPCAAENEIIITSVNGGQGKLTRVSWTLDSQENPTFAITTLKSAPPPGFAPVGLDCYNGMISVSQRAGNGEHLLLADN